VAAIGSGATTDVFRARDLVLGRPVALKLMRAGTRTRSGKAFTAAAREAAGLSHPNIAAVYDTGEHTSGRGTHTFLITELCERRDLSGRWEAPAAASLAAQICAALEHAHSRGLAHGNLVPENIYATPEGTVKVADFGLSAAAEGRAVEPVDDVRALGELLFLLLTGRPPAEPAPGLRSIRAGIPRTIETAVARALGAGEPLTAEGFRRMLGGAGQAPEREPATTQAVTPATSVFDPRWMIPVALLIAVAIVAALVVPDDEELPEPGEPVQAGSETRIEVVTVDDFDPGGDGDEHAELVGMVDDNDLTTSWHSETYHATFQQVKPEHPGIGLIFDLGRPVQVSRVQIHSPTPGYGFELLRSSRPAEDEKSWAAVATVEQARDVAEMNEFETASSRYWLLWITSLPGGGTGSVSISEVRFFGP
jgi:hypothetical protein